MKKTLARLLIAAINSKTVSMDVAAYVFAVEHQLPFTDRRYSTWADAASWIDELIATDFDDRFSDEETLDEVEQVLWLALKYVAVAENEVVPCNKCGEYHCGFNVINENIRWSLTNGNSC